MSSPNLGKPGVAETSAGVFSTSGATFHDSGCAENPSTVPVLAISPSVAGVSNNNTAAYAGLASTTQTDPTVQVTPTIVVEAVDGPSPSVGSGASLPYGIVTDTTDGLTIQGTGVSLTATGLSQTTITNHTVESIPSTVPVQQLGPGASGVQSGLTGSELTQQNATTITNPVPANPSTTIVEPIAGSSPYVNGGMGKASQAVGSATTTTEQTTDNLSGIIAPLDGSSPNVASGLPAVLAVGSVTTSTSLEGLGPA